MDHTATTILDSLLQLSPRRTAEAPRNARGIYGLVDHLGALRYIGSTSSISQTLYERIHQRHRTGSEDMSHYFSLMYNVGRMWRDRHDTVDTADAGHAKALRNAFIAEYCAAVWVVVPDNLEIAALERQILAMAPGHAIAWNGRSTAIYDEPADLVDATLMTLGWSDERVAAVERQRQRHSGQVPVAKNALLARPALTELPAGEFRFFALDVETANNDRASICQIGVACGRVDGAIETWKSYIDPQTNVWSCSGIHGITARTVRGAPAFEQVYSMLESALGGKTVYQHSPFDQGAIAAACARDGLAMPTWTWRDSVQVARQAWPELKGNGGHGLASLKRHLGLTFNHHDAGEDARASATIVLHAERLSAVGDIGSASIQKTAMPILGWLGNGDHRSQDLPERSARFRTVTLQLSKGMAMTREEATIIARDAGSRVFAIGLRGATKDQVMVPVRASRGENAGTYVVSLTRFADDQIRVRTMDEVMEWVRKGYGVRMAPLGRSSPSNLFSSASIHKC